MVQRRVFSRIFGVSIAFSEICGKFFSPPAFSRGKISLPTESCSKESNHSAEERSGKSLVQSFYILFSAFNGSTDHFTSYCNHSFVTALFSSTNALLHTTFYSGKI
jgi:hypothetical protein